MSLRNKFLLPTMTLIIVGMGLSAFVTDRAARKAIENIAITQIEQLADSSKMQIDAWLKTVRVELDWLTGESVLRNVSGEQNSVGRISRNMAATRLNAIQEKYRFFDYLLILSEDGKVLVTSGEVSENVEFTKDIPLFQEILPEEQSFSEVFINSMTSTPAFAVSASFMEGANAEILIGVISMDYVEETFISPLSFGQTGYGYVLNHEGIAVVHPSEKSIMDPTFKNFDFVHTMLDSPEGLVTYEFDKRPKKAAFRRIEQSGWVLAVVSDTKELFAPARQISVMNVSVASAMIVLAAGLIYLIAKTVIKPLGGEPGVMVEMAQRIADGELDISFDRGGQRATGLYAAMKNMTETLARLSANIEGLIGNIREGRLDLRSNVEGFRGGWRKLIVDLNDLMDAFAAPVIENSKCIERMARGDVPERIDSEYRGDFDRMTQNLNALIGATGEVVSVAQQIAGGNLNVTVEPRSEQDELMLALQQMTGYLQEVATVAERVSSNDLEVSIRPKSENDVLNLALQRMVANLKATIDELEKSMRDINEQNWLRSGQAELSDVMRGEQDEAVLAQNVIAYLAKYTGSQIGALYLAVTENEETLLQLAGSYAYLRRKGSRNTFRLGESLVGQAALEQERIVFSDIPEDYVSIGSGLGEIVPHHILVVPFLYDGELQGVLELGSSDKFSRNATNFLEQVVENIGIAFHSAKTRKKMEELLEATRQQAETLQSQQEELRVSNEELETQTQTLRASEMQLQQQQEELRQTNEELEQQTRNLELQQTEMQEKNRALQLAQREIGEKARDLERSSKYKSEFLANMSHELRTPLNSLLILAKLLMNNKEGNLTEKQMDFARTIHKSGSELLLLINEVLDLSKVEAGKMELNLEEMSMQSLANYVEQHFSHVALEKQLELRIELSPELPISIYSDCQRVEQIVKNLLSNAFKFTKQGKITVGIARQVEKSMIAIRVADTGIGIPAEKLRHIFEAFQQVDGTTSRQYGGTGLGLSISRELSHLLGGELSVTSEEGKGSCFTLLIPEHIEERKGVVQSDRHAEQSGRRRSDAVTSNSIIPNNDRLQKTAEQGWDERIVEDGTQAEEELQEANRLLIVEDDIAARKSLTEVLKEVGPEVQIDTTAMGEDALRFLQERQYHCLVLDLGLEDMSGFDLLEKIHDIPSLETLPIVVYTGKDLSKDEERLLSSYAESTIVKGIRSQERLLDEVTLFLQQMKAQSPGEQRPKVHHGKDVMLHEKTILVVDDDMRNVYALSNVLDDKGLTVLTAEDGKEALELLDEHGANIDLVLMDIMMPGMDGYQTIERIRKQKSFAHLPIVALTAKAMKGDRQKCLDVGANDYLSKPIDIDKLFSLLRVWLS